MVCSYKTYSNIFLLFIKLYLLSTYDRSGLNWAGCNLLGFLPQMEHFLGVQFGFGKTPALIEIAKSKKKRRTSVPLLCVHRAFNYCQCLQKSEFYSKTTPNGHLSVAVWVDFGVQIDYWCWLKSIPSNGENRVYQERVRSLIYLLSRLFRFYFWVTLFLFFHILLSNSFFFCFLFFFQIQQVLSHFSFVNLFFWRFTILEKFVSILNLVFLIS